MNSLFLLLVVLAVPGRPGTADMEQVIHREWVSASSAAACQAHADRRAGEYREKLAAEVARLKAKVNGVCTPQKEFT